MYPVLRFIETQTGPEFRNSSNWAYRRCSFKNRLKNPAPKNKSTARLHSGQKARRRKQIPENLYFGSSLSEELFFFTRVHYSVFINIFGFLFFVFVGGFEVFKLFRFFKLFFGFVLRKFGFVAG